jgi:hypothetical protein
MLSILIRNPFLGRLDAVCFSGKAFLGRLAVRGTVPETVKDTVFTVPQTVKRPKKGLLILFRQLTFVKS